MPQELLERTRGRVKVVAWLCLAGALISFSVRLYIALDRTGTGSTKDFIGVSYAAIVAVASSLLIGATYLKRKSPGAILGYALSFEVLLGYLISVGNTWLVYSKYGHFPFLTWATPVIVIFPLLIPSPPRLTLLTALATGSSAPASLAILSSFAGVPVTFANYVEACASPAIAITVAYFGSRVIHGITVEYAQARRMGSYELKSLIGEGAMGEVWLARHQMLARPAAIKLIRPDIVGAEGENADEIRERFVREAQATSLLRSPHTIEVYDFGVAANGAFYYVMELLNGLDLRTLVRRYGPLPQERAVHVLRQICESLSEAHQRGLIHRDIKPANVFLCRYGILSDFVKVLDFGLVKSLAAIPGAALNQTAESIIQGTPAFMAPEQIGGHGPTTAASDIYALGCLAHWLVTGEYVFSAKTSLAIMAHHSHSQPPRPSSRAPAPVSQPFDELILRCLEKDPHQRPRSVDELEEQLRNLTPAEAWTKERAKHWWDANVPHTDVSALETESDTGRVGFNTQTDLDVDSSLPTAPTLLAVRK